MTPYLNTIELPDLIFCYAHGNYDAKLFEYHVCNSFSDLLVVDFDFQLEKNSFKSSLYTSKARKRQ